MNKETFKQTYLPLSASMYRTAYRILGNPEDAEDMVQEAYMKLWKQRDTLDGILDARAYAVTSVKNLCLDHTETTPLIRKLRKNRTYHSCGIHSLFRDHPLGRSRIAAPIYR